METSVNGSNSRFDRTGYSFCLKVRLSSLVRSAGRLDRLDCSSGLFLSLIRMCLCMMV
ncbi:hypothetical protein HanRHA438_Chr01g0012971 [Helianthus annuus]|nr:hypothetical protein HanRHA438_Chr01g0012971 [Helianthus annuus]